MVNFYWYERDERKNCGICFDNECDDDGDHNDRVQWSSDPLIGILGFYRTIEFFHLNSNEIMKAIRKISNVYRCMSVCMCVKLCVRVCKTKRGRKREESKFLIVVIMIDRSDRASRWNWTCHSFITCAINLAMSNFFYHFLFLVKSPFSLFFYKVQSK